MSETYSAWQVYDALKRQGYDEEQAMAMAGALGTGRADESTLQKGYNAVGAEDAKIPTGDDGGQDSSLVPNVGEGVGTLGGLYAAKKLGYTKELPHDAGRMKKLGRLAKIGGVVVPSGIAGTLAATALSGNNFYDRASDPQILADIGGGLAGGLLGEKYGERLGEKVKNTGDAISKKGAAATKKVADSKLVEKYGGKALKSGLGRVASGLGGRTIGGALGMALGPIGAAAGTIAGGWLVPKLFSDGTTSVEDEKNNFLNPF